MRAGDLNLLLAAERRIGDLRSRRLSLRRHLRDGPGSRELRGELVRFAPLSDLWGGERGRRIDRVLIESFLADHAADVRGRVLEIEDDDYTRRFGGDRVTRSEILDVDPTNRRATLIDDLRTAETVEEASLDCAIVTQTLHVLDEPDRAVARLRSLLAPGGVLLATVPTLSRIAPETGPDGDYWRLGERAARDLVAGLFPPDGVSVRCLGNRRICLAFLAGLAEEDLHPDDFDDHDPRWPLVVGIRAVVPEAG